MDLQSRQKLMVRQARELAELFGFETRNKYQILSESQELIGYAAEQQKGLLALLLRSFLGHWRTFTILFFDSARKQVMVALHPFRFFFQRLEISTPEGKFLGALQQRFSLLYKRFDVENENGQVILEVASPIWKIWTFPFAKNGKEVAFVRKKWSGILSEVFTDRDNFLVEFADPSLSDSERKLVLAAALFIDLQYFEKKAKS